MFFYSTIQPAVLFNPCTFDRMWIAHLVALLCHIKQTSLNDYLHRNATSSSLKMHIGYTLSHAVIYIPMSLKKTVKRVVEAHCKWSGQIWSWKEASSFCSNEFCITMTSPQAAPISLIKIFVPPFPAPLLLCSKYAHKPESTLNCTAQIHRTDSTY